MSAPLDTNTAAEAKIEKPIPGISYLVDSNGKRTSIVIDLKMHIDALEDFLDYVEAKAISDDPDTEYVSLDELMKELGITNQDLEEVEDV